MANEKDKLRTLKEINKEIEGRKQNLKDIQALEDKGYNSAVKTKDVEKQRVNLIKESYKLEADSVSLSKQIGDLKKSGLRAMNKELGLEKEIVGLEKIAAQGDVKKNKAASNYTSLLNDINEGKDFESILNKAAIDDYGEMEEAVSDLIDTLRESPEILAKLGREKKFADMIDQVKDTLGIIDLKKTFTFAGLLAVAAKFASKIFEVRQSLGTSAVDSARLAGNMSAAGIAAKAVGGNSQEAEAAVMSLVDEFGSLSVVSAGVSTQLGLITGQFGLSGANAGKLLKSMQAINGASIETNLNLIGVVGSLARAEGVSPAQVLNDIAQDTETFANFAKDGGKNIAKAAIEARKLGLNLGTVAGIAESLLDFETSIESQMKASVLLGRQINTDKARELALSGDLKGLAIEIKNQVGSQAEFEEMNVVQRKALAEAMGVTVSDLGKIIAGKATEAELAEKSAEEEKKKLVTSERLNFISAAANVIAGTAGIIAAVRAQTEITITNEKGKQALLETKSLGKSIANAVTSLARGVGSIFSGMGVLGPIGLVLAGAGVASMYASSKKAKSSVPKAETGGIVKQSGLAEIHKGEAISGTKNELGFGADMTETNVLIKKHIAESVQLREQNQFLMNKLIRATGDLQLANA